MDSERILHKGGGVTLVGPDAMKFMQACTVRSAIGLYIKCGMLAHRGLTIRKLLDLAESFTGNHYRKSKAEHQRAHDELGVWIETMRAALPTTDNREAA